MTTTTEAAAIERAAKAAAGFPGLRLLLLHGSRARGDVHEGSDWDFAFVGEAGVDGLALGAALATAVGADVVDLADLSRASGLLRYRAARDGLVVHERIPGEHERFWTESVRFWCDAEPLVSAGMRDVLRGLGP